MKTLKREKILAALVHVFPNLREMPNRYNDWHLPTIHGSLFIHPADNAIRTHFEAIPESAPDGAPLNRYSGKWNFEGVDNNDTLLWAIGKILNIAVKVPS
jgi:hypothetical protein